MQTTIWQLDKTSHNLGNAFCIKIELVETVNKNWIIIKHPLEPRLTRVMSETEKYIFLTTEQALKWLKITLNHYKFDTEFWHQTVKRIKQIEADEQAPKIFIRRIHEYQKFVKKTHFDFHYTGADIRRNALAVENLESKINQ